MAQSVFVARTSLINWDLFVGSLAELQLFSKNKKAGKSQLFCQFYPFNGQGSADYLAFAE
jgi:hypothetical protein